MYATLLLWLLSELFEELPEAGDLDKPKLVFFFDEAHLLFNDAPKALIEKIEQVVRLIRSKGVGVYFVTQNPLDVPETILGQLGNRVQHALRAFSPKDQKAVRAAAQTFRANPNLDTETAITELGVGEALVSVLDEKGQPTPVERVLICPPQSRIGPLSDSERSEQMQRSPLRSKYEQTLDRESAYETLARACATCASRKRTRRGEARARGTQPHRRFARRLRQKRGAQHRFAGRPRNHARRAGLAAGQQSATALKALRWQVAAPDSIQIAFRYAQAFWPREIKAALTGLRTPRC